MSQNYASSCLFPKLLIYLKTWNIYSYVKYFKCQLLLMSRTVHISSFHIQYIDKRKKDMKKKVVSSRVTHFLWEMLLIRYVTTTSYIMQVCWTCWPSNKGQKCLQQVMHPCDVYCPMAVSSRNIGIPQASRNKTYGTKNAPGRKVMKER